LDQKAKVVFGPVETDLDGSKIIWISLQEFGLVKICFGPLEGQGINHFRNLFFVNFEE